MKTWNHEYGLKILTRSKLHEEDVGSRTDFAVASSVFGVVHDGLLDTAVKHVFLTSDPGESMARSGVGQLLSLLVEVFPFNIRWLEAELGGQPCGGCWGLTISK